jgi:Flp pilus assembly pilin Flp
MESTGKKPQAGDVMRSDDGGVLVEYALLLALLSLPLFAALVAIEGATVNAYSNVTTELLYYAERNGQ